MEKQATELIRHSFLNKLQAVDLCKYDRSSPAEDRETSDFYAGNKYSYSQVDRHGIGAPHDKDNKISIWLGKSLSGIIPWDEG